jgi:hypothetical protein
MNNDFIQPPFEHIAEPDPTFEDAIDVLPKHECFGPCE